MAGVCGKKADTAQMQDKLTGTMVKIAIKALQEPDKITPGLTQDIINGLFTTVTNVNFNNETIRELDLKLKNDAYETFDTVLESYDMRNVWEADEDIRSLKSLILFGIRGMAAYAYHAAVLGYHDLTVDMFFYKALAAIGNENYGLDKLLQIVLEVGEKNHSCMAMLDKANTESYGNPVPVSVPLKVEKGPFIVITGHDLYDLKQLLEQTKGKGINIYTHGEMLPAHGYPELKKYPHLKGNFGTAWQNQQKEFASIPAPILFTTNCLMPPKPSYADRVFTTEIVSYPEIVHIGKEKDFTPVILKALELGGYSEDTQFTGINGGTSVMTGFAKNAVLSVADKIIENVKNGSIKHFFLVGGCDGAKTGRNYYTEFVKKTPADTIVLTLACGKFRVKAL